MIDFPASPVLNDTYTYGGKTWQWDGAKWLVASDLAGDHGDITVSTDGDDWQIDNGAVSLANLSDLTGPTILGKQTGTGAPEALTPENARLTLALGTAAVSNVPSTGNATGTEVVIATDTRLTNSRTPTAHAASHGSGQSDAITIAAGQVTGLSGTYAPLASPVLTGTPRAPTAALGTNSTQIATTAYVMTRDSGSAPAAVSTGTSGSAGTGSAWSRWDHVHGYPSNMVTTTTTQTVTGAKTFSNNVTFSAGTTNLSATTTNMNSTNTNIYYGVVPTGYIFSSLSADGIAQLAGHSSLVQSNTTTTAELRMNAGYTGGEGYALTTYQRRGVGRWWVGKTNDSEVGSNSGSDYAIMAVNDAGSLLSTPLKIDRASGAITLQPLTNAIATLRNGHTAQKVYLSTGNPESAKDGAIGSLYMDLAATNGAIGHVKKTGASETTTGWVPFYGDTGWRLISSTLANSWAGSLYMRRVNSTVTAYFDGVTQSATPTSNTFYDGGIAAGFQPDKPSAGSLVKAIIPVSFASNATAASLSVTTLGFAVTPSSGTIDDTWGAITGQVSWTTSDAWPSTLPGTEA